MRNLTLFHILPITIAFILAVVVYYPRLSILEGEVLPVVENVEIVSTIKGADGITVFLKFDKTRNCEFYNLNWYKNNVRLLINFAPEREISHHSRALGAQLIGPWYFYDIEKLEGTHAEIIHSCHPLWRTITHFYPPRNNNNGNQD